MKFVSGRPSSHTAYLVAFPRVRVARMCRAEPRQADPANEPSHAALRLRSMPYDHYKIVDRKRSVINIQTVEASSGGFLFATVTLRQTWETVHDRSKNAESRRQTRPEIAIALI